MNVGIVCGILMIICGIGTAVSFIADKFDMSRYVLKTDVVEAMNGNYIVHKFSCNNDNLTDKKGNDKFYSVQDIDEKIEKLNKVLKN